MNRLRHLGNCCAENYEYIFAMGFLFAFFLRKKHRDWDLYQSEKHFFSLNWLAKEYNNTDTQTKNHIKASAGRSSATKQAIYHCSEAFLVLNHWLWEFSTCTALGLDYQPSSHQGKDCIPGHLRRLVHFWVNQNNF